jgi:CubicO group peptidase (beta-lactamase class C family)
MVGSVDVLKQVDDWPVATAAVAVLRRVPPGASTAATTGSVELVGAHGPRGHVFPLASVTKILVAYAALIALEEGALELDQPAGPEGSTVRHLLAHASGLAFVGNRVLAGPGTRRIYSNSGFEVLGEVLAAASGVTVAEYLAEGVTGPLGMSDTRLAGSPAYGAGSSVADLGRFAAELLVPRLVHPSTAAAATSVVFPGLSGVLPGYGVANPNDWGLGFEIRGGKSPHWTGTTSGPATFGHFGRSGTFLWVDPALGAACVCLTDREFGEWALAAWPRLTDDILTVLATS